MKCFWWFDENKIAGMARPGFNHVHWFDLPFDEGIVLGWLGQFPSGKVSFDSFSKHVNSYGPKIFQFYNLTDEQGYKTLEIFNSPEGFKTVFDKLNQRTKFYEHFEMNNNAIEFETSRENLKNEIEFMKQQGIDKVVTLTEHHHNKESLSQHFETHHIAIQDLGAPDLKQVNQLAKLMNESEQKSQKIAVHCLAGIGRTSTMIVAAKLLQGHSVENLKKQINEKNPHFAFSGTQGNFIMSVAQEVKSSRT
jgi:protein-tyrosine phosphatase